QARPSTFARGALLCVRGFHAAATDEPAQALMHFRGAVELGLAMGFLHGAVWASQEEMVLLALSGRSCELDGPRRSIAQIFETFPSPLLKNAQDFVEALIELLAHGPAAARPRLSRALTRARASGVFLLPLASEKGRTALVGAALELDLERTYVASLARRYGMTPPAEDTGPVWPWPLVIRTLGPFSIAIGKEPPSQARPAAGPLRLMKALVAAGGGPVSCRRLIAELWVRSDAVEGRTSLDTTLHRLRSALGDDSLVLLENGEVRLDRRRIWCDAWALHHLRIQAQQAAADIDADGIGRLDRRLRSIYSGPFCPDDSETFLVRARAKLAGIFADTASVLADGWLRLGEDAPAIALLESALEADELNEALYAKLMAVHAARGAVAEAVRLYERCATTFRSRLGVDPSAQTRQLATSLRPMAAS
ncbi:MAG: BTAD domain-containing putative transcriptional regulator, partial [Myxococcales bacterium]